MNDNECFKWSIVKNLHSPDHHPARIKAIDEILTYELDFTGKKFPVKIKGSHKIAQKNSINISDEN